MARRRGTCVFARAYAVDAARRSRRGGGVGVWSCSAAAMEFGRLIRHRRDTGPPTEGKEDAVAHLKLAYAIRPRNWSACWPHTSNP